MKKNPEKKLFENLSFSGAAAIYKLTNSRPIIGKLESSKNLALRAFIIGNLRYLMMVQFNQKSFRASALNGMFSENITNLVLSMAELLCKSGCTC